MLGAPISAVRLLGSVHQSPVEFRRTIERPSIFYAAQPKYLLHRDLALGLDNRAAYDYMAEAFRRAWGKKTNGTVRQPIGIL